MVDVPPMVVQPSDQGRHVFIDGLVSLLQPLASLPINQIGLQV